MATLYPSGVAFKLDNCCLWSRSSRTARGEVRPFLLAHRQLHLHAVASVRNKGDVWGHKTVGVATVLLLVGKEEVLWTGLWLVMAESCLG
jgi:hypothetical protein